MSHGVNKKTKQEQMKATGPKKSILIVKEKKEEIFYKVQLEHWDTLCNAVKEFKEVFLDKLPKGHPPKRGVEHHIETILGVKPPCRPPYRLEPTKQDEMEEQVKDLLEQGFIRHQLVYTVLQYSLPPKRTGDEGCVRVTEHLIN